MRPKDPEHRDIGNTQTAPKKPQGQLLAYLGTWNLVSPWKGLESVSLMKGTLQGRSPAAPGAESRPSGVPHPPWEGSVFCQSRGSQGERRGGHLQRGPFRGQRESGSQERIPGLLGGGPRAAAGRLPSQCLQTWPRPLPAAVRFLSIPLPFFLLPSSSSGNLPAETHHSLMPRGGQYHHPAETRGRTSSHAPHLPFSAT